MSASRIFRPHAVTAGRRDATPDEMEERWKTCERTILASAPRARDFKRVVMPHPDAADLVLCWVIAMEGGQR